MSNSLLYQIALTLIPNIGPVQAKLLLQHYDVEESFKAKKDSLEKLEGIGEYKAKIIKSFDNFGAAEQEIDFIEKNKITPFFITDKEYPQRLLNCYDYPTLLYYKGEANLNVSKIISVIGSRSHTDYGRRVTEKLLE